MTHKHKTRFTLLLILFFTIITLSITYASTEKIIFKENIEKQNNKSEQSIKFDEKKLNKWYYRINFNIKNIWTKNDEVIWNIIIDSKNNSHISYYKEIYLIFFYIFKYSRKFDIEFEVFKNNTVFLPYIYITKNSVLSVEDMNIEKIKKPKNKIDKNIKTKIYEEGDFFSNWGVILSNNNTDNNKILVANTDYSKNKYIIFWPYSKDEKPWKQKAIFRLKSSNNKTDKYIAKIEVFNPNWNWTNKYLNIKWTDFKEENEFQNFEINYERTDKWSIEFRVLYLWNVNLIFDKVTNIWEY